MATDHPSVSLKLDILPKPTLKAFMYLSQQEWLLADHWYLAGGTSLALQFGHRLSVDLDFFTPAADFDGAAIITRLTAQGWRTTLKEKGTVYGELHQTKMSFIAYPYFVPAAPYLRHQHLQLLDVADIAVMKIVAISQRGKKRDFVDLYWYIHQCESLNNILARVDRQFPATKQNFHHIFKSLTYFVEADQDPDLQLLVEIDWQEVKQFFLDTVPPLAQQFFSPSPAAPAAG